GGSSADSPARNFTSPTGGGVVWLHGLGAGGGRLFLHALDERKLVDRQGKHAGQRPGHGRRHGDWILLFPHRGDLLGRARTGQVMEWTKGRFGPAPGRHDHHGSTGGT